MGKAEEIILQRIKALARTRGYIKACLKDNPHDKLTEDCLAVNFRGFEGSSVYCRVRGNG